MTTPALIARYYAAFNAKDWAGMLACVADDLRHDVNEGATRGGKARFAEFLAHMDRCYDERLDDVVIMTDPSEARAAAEFIVHGRYKATDDGLPPAHGQTYVLPAGAFFEVRDGLIIRVTTRYNLKDWIAQVS
ncbi:MAG: ketosteroid isomerase-related protein [Hyphomonadaceae bacterium]|nr:ketosteroid isomerase-related protein [Hyphomonadaceae bacterium]